MGNSNLFRVLDVDAETVTVNPILDEGGKFSDHDEAPVTVSTTESKEDIAQVVSLLSPGHVISATITRSSPHQFSTLEHRGGATLVELDPRTVPYLITEFWAQNKSPSPEELRDEELVVPFEELVEEPAAQELNGELHIQFSSETSTQSWANFTQGTGSESVYGSFETRDGKPTEIFIGNPDGERYGYAVLFAAERTAVAKQIRAQYGHLYDDQYLPNPAWNLSTIIDGSALPDDPDKNPKEIFHPDYNVHSSTLPSRFGSDTIQLIAELVFVGTQFEMTFSEPSEHFDPDHALTSTVDDLDTEPPDIVTMYKFYIALLTGIYDAVGGNPDTDIQSLIDDGVIPAPEVLFRTHQQFVSQVHSLEAYFEKMRHVPIEQYVADLFSGEKPWEAEFKAQFDIDGFPLMIRFILQDLEKQLDEINEILTVAQYIADAERTANGFT